MMFNFGILRFQIEVRRNENGETDIRATLDIEQSHEVKYNLNSMNLQNGTYFVKVNLDENNMQFCPESEELERGMMLAINEAIKELSGNNRLDNH
jgi:hypothetical protein